MTEDKYYSIRIPKSLVKKLDEYLKEPPEYVSRLDIIKEAIRMHIRENQR